MTDSGWNPARRNRNIGTSKQGHGADNRLVIPKAWPDDRVFWEVLDNPLVISRSVGENAITFLVEAATRGCIYPCTVDDLVAVLELVPPDHLDGLDLIILRQPSRKQQVVSSVWGRFLYYATPGQYSGTAICIEAQDPSLKMIWPKSLTPSDQNELARLKQDGHEVRQNRRGYEIVSTPEAIRNTVLFRTLFHEVGHYVDWLQSVIWPCSKIDDPVEDERISQAFDSKPSKEREDFAHRYSAELSESLRGEGLIPFRQHLRAETMLADGLKPEWFPSGGVAA